MINIINMLMVKSRNNRKPFTFWLEEDSKKELKKIAGILGTTTTELINRAVRVYIEKELFKDDSEDSRLVTSQLIADELRIKQQVEERLVEMGLDTDLINQRLSNAEKRLKELEESQTIGEVDIQSKVATLTRKYIEESVVPVLRSVEHVIQQLPHDQ